jgi:hypothetical protein
MAYNTQLSDVAANAACNALTAQANSGYLKIYTGSEPASGNTAPSGTLLASFPLAATAFNGASGGTATLVVPASVTAGNTGTAAYFAIVKSDNSTVVLYGSCGTSGCNLNLSTVAIASGALVSITSYSFSINESNLAG